MSSRIQKYEVVVPATNGELQEKIGLHLGNLALQERIPITVRPEGYDPSDTSADETLALDPRHVRIEDNRFVSLISRDEHLGSVNVNLAGEPDEPATLTRVVIDPESSFGPRPSGLRLVS